jgi:hypothetical protein
MSLPTIQEIKKIIGDTWFEFEGDETVISLDTRDHGDIGGEEPGSADITEAKRIIRLLRGEFPNLSISGDTCDEWVSVEIREK